MTEAWVGGGLDCPLKLKLVLTEAPTILEKGKGEHCALHKAGVTGVILRSVPPPSRPPLSQERFFFFLTQRLQVKIKQLQQQKKKFSLF